MFNKIYKYFVLWMLILFTGIITDTTELYAKDEDGDYVILIDPGHGNTDCGTISKNKDYESDIVYDIAMALKAELQTYEGVKVYLTRGSGEYQNNGARGFMGDVIKSDLNVSLHCNSVTQSYVRGIVVYGTVDTRFQGYMQLLAKYINSEVNALGIPCYLDGYENRRGSLNSARDYYTFLEVSSICNIPSVIIEHAYLSNPEDSEFLHQRNNRYRMGVADATGIAKYLNLKKRVIEENSSITLTRTYSSYINLPEGTTYRSSDKSIAYVDSNGLITALKPGTATITCTKADGTTSEISVTVPQVEIKSLSAGLVQKCYRNLEQAKNYNKDHIILKAIYTDGSATQILKDYTIGELYEGDVIDAGTANQMTIVNVPITYGNQTGLLRFFHYYHTPGQKNRISTAIETTVIPTKENRDIALAPGEFATGDYVQQVKPPVEKPTQAPTQETTVAPTQAPTESLVPVPTIDVTTASQAATSEETTTQKVTENLVPGFTVNQTTEENQSKTNVVSTEYETLEQRVDLKDYTLENIFVGCVMVLITIVCIFIIYKICRKKNI